MRLNFGWRPKSDEFFKSFLPHFQVAPQLCTGFSELEIGEISVLTGLEQARCYISSCQTYGEAVTPNDRRTYFQWTSMLCNRSSRSKSICFTFVSSVLHGASVFSRFSACSRHGEFCIDPTALRAL